MATERGGRATIAYLINRYPMPSLTFVRREIRALEELGMPVVRYGIRPTTGEIVDPEDLAEVGCTRTMLSGAFPATLLMAVLHRLIASPQRFFGALRSAIGLSRGSDRGLLTHLAYLAEACVLVGWCRADRIDHLHTHFGTNGPAVAMLSRRLGGPTFSFTVHGPEEFDRPEALHLGAKVADASFVVAISSFGRSQLLRWSDPADWDRIHVVRCGIPLGSAVSSSVPVEPRFVTVGRLAEQKGQIIAIEAIAMLAERGRRPTLVIAGEGPLRPELEAAIVDHDVGDLVSITGWLTNAEVTAAIERSRALVLPSFAEGLPIVIMEAFAAFRPVISTYVAAIPELVDDGNGWLVPAGDAEALAAAMEAAMDDPTIDARAANGRAAVERGHDVTASARRLAMLFDAAVAAERSAAGPSDATNC